MTIVEPHNLSVREAFLSDIPAIADYWKNASPAYLLAMGADADKIPTSHEFIQMLTQQMMLPPEDKSSYPLILLCEGAEIGHCNLTQINYEKNARMHIHLWEEKYRQKGIGHQFVLQCLPTFFETFQLKKIICEPYAANTAPNNTLKKVGFTFKKLYVTKPGAINFEQEVCRWEMTRKQFEKIKAAAE